MAGGTAGSAKPPVLLSSVVFGLPELFVPRGVRQTPTDLELLSVVRTAVGHCIDSVSEPIVHLTGSDYSGSKIEDFRHDENRRFSNDLIAWGGQAAIVGLIGIALFPV